MRLLHAIVHLFFYIISLIPLRVLYLLSDFMTFLFYHVFKYRRSVVMENLLIAFPEKSDKERKKIARDFYQNIADSLVETFKMLSASDRMIEKMFIVDHAVLGSLLDTDKKIQIHTMHNFNWEVVNLGISKNFKLPFLGVYQPLKNQYFEKLFSTIRSRYGTVLIPATDFKNNFLPFKDKQYIIALVADQNPKRIAQSWWVDFFGVPTAFTQGPEKAARLSNNRIVFGTFFKLKRGVYSFSVEVVTDDPASMQPGELTLKYVDYVQQAIRERPANYLWSHRRWKHRYNASFASLRLISADR